MRDIIFDLDGTLIDPSIAICRSINYALKMNGFSTCPVKELLPYIGRHLIEPFSILTGNKTEKFLWKLIYSYRERFETIGIAENFLYPEIKEMLESITARKYIASIKPEKASTLILKELGVRNFFSGIYGSELDGRRSDKSELLRYLVEKEDIIEGIMVGDRDTDIFAAKKCGFISIGVSYGYGAGAELKDAGADIIVGSPKELRTELDRL